MHRLITIPMSHYNERAKWALELCGISYRELGYLPLFHLAPVLRHGLGRGSGQADRASTRFSTPLLVTPDGQRLHDSAKIVAYAAGHRPDALDVSDEACELAQLFHDRLGPKTRLLVYHWGLPDAGLMTWIAQQNVGAVQARVLEHGYPLFRRAMVRALGVTPARAEKALIGVRQIFTEVSERIEGRVYLAGDRFSTADLTFASLASLALGVTQEDGYGAIMPPIERYPQQAQALMRELRETEAGKFALRMYREERPTRVRKAGPR